MTDAAMLGRIGTVVVEVRGGGMPGEIRVLDGGEPIMLMAYCADPAAVGRRVRIVGDRGPRQVDVALWP